MGLRKIRHQVANLCWRLLVGTAGRVPEWNQISEFDGHGTACDPERRDLRPRNTSEVCGEVAAALATTQRADIAVNKCSSLSDVVQGVLGRDSNTTISNVLVLGTENSPPLKRVELRLADPREVSSTLNRLAVALQKGGADLGTVQHPGIPVNEIWLTSALHDGKKMLLSCASMVGLPAAQRVDERAASPRPQTQ